MSVEDKVLLRNKIVGILIRDARLASGKTQEECADYLGMSASWFSDIEYGESALSLPELEAIALLLDVPLEHLLGDQLLEVVEEPALPVQEMLDLRSRVIGVLLRQARVAAGKTQEECGEFLNVPDSRISAYEHGEKAVPLAELEYLAQFLQVPLETFADQEYNPISQRKRQDQALEQISHLPKDLQQFLLDPLNADYLRTAQRLSKMPAGQLRGIAETLLEITY